MLCLNVVAVICARALYKFRKVKQRYQVKGCHAIAINVDVDVNVDMSRDQSHRNIHGVVALNWGFLQICFSLIIKAFFIIV